MDVNKRKVPWAGGEWNGLRHAGVSCGVDEDFGGATGDSRGFRLAQGGWTYLCAMDEDFAAAYRGRSAMAEVERYRLACAWDFSSTNEKMMR